MRLLLVEDNERFAVLLKRGLVAAGFVVDVLPTAKDAGSALREGRFEIVVLDLGLPDIDGADAHPVGILWMQRFPDAHARIDSGLEDAGPLAARGSCAAGADGAD